MLASMKTEQLVGSSSTSMWRLFHIVAAGSGGRRGQMLASMKMSS